MSARDKYSKESLYSVTGTLKRTILNQVRKEQRFTISKQEVFDLLAPKLGLSSSRSLWKSKHKDYLDNWYQKLEDEIEHLVPEENTKEISKIKIETNEEINKIIEESIRKDKLISQLEMKIKILHTENEKLRLLHNGRYAKIDLE